MWLPLSSYRGNRKLRASVENEGVVTVKNRNALSDFYWAADYELNKETYD